MKTVKKIITLIVFLILLCSMLGCSDADLAVPENNTHLNLEGAYEGTLAGDMGFGDSVGQIAYNISLDGDKMLFVLPGDSSWNFEGPYDFINNEFISSYFGRNTEEKGVVVRLRFYEEEWVVKASGVIAPTHIDPSDSRYEELTLDLVKRSD